MAENLLSRRPSIQRLLQGRTDKLLVVAGLGSAIWDVESAGENPLNYYLLGAMGSVVPTALGLALAQPERRVLALTGDAELMMGLYTLPTVAVRRPRNLVVACIDNERFGETGSQPAHTAQGVDLAGMARASGFPLVREVYNEDGIDALRTALYTAEGPLFAVIKVSGEMPPVVMPIRDGATGKARFREALLGERGLKE
ncbi:MAG TPA: thiamine pyrophosphate-dependent enzyme [Alphaproteobacteria bacterium]|nr:thiamine pyrophosphate-dependent enzyme [Alphaproteobacteria bacterium]